MMAPWTVPAIVVGLVTASTGYARADYDPEWRDGCPGGNLTHLPDVQYRKADTLESYAGTRPDLVGALPQPDSAFGRNQLGIDSVLAHSATVDANTPSTLVAGAALRGAINIPIGHLYHLRWSTGLHATLSRRHFEEGGQMVNHLGNLVLQPEFRWQWTATGSNTVDSIGDPEHQAAGLRNGIALQAIVARPFDQSVAARTSGAMIWRRDAFEGYLVSPRPTWGGAIEIRSEGVGCYAPFIHLRLSLTVTDAATDPSDVAHEHMVFLAPQTLSFGFALSSHASVLVQYGLLVYVARGDSGPGFPLASLIETSALHRLRFGGEKVFAGGQLTAAASLDLFLGSQLYHGTRVGVSLTWNMGDWK